MWTIAWTGIQLAIIVILGVGAWRADRGLIEVSSLIAFLLYAFQLMGPVTELTQNVTSLQAGIAAARAGSGRSTPSRSSRTRAGACRRRRADWPSDGTGARVPRR